MKKSYLLTSIIALSSIASINSMEQRRPEVYTMIDALIVNRQGAINWPAIFAVIDAMKDIITVNEYTTPYGYTLLEEAILNENLLVTKELLEKYHADPNRGEMKPLIIACQFSSIPMIKLLLMHGANPYAIDYVNHDSFHYAANKPVILELLRSYNQ